LEIKGEIERELEKGREGEIAGKEERYREKG
jgi:hypothetical protein